MTTRNASTPARILVTGFGPFPGVHDNPSARLVQWLDTDGRWARRPEMRLATAVLPAAWQALPSLVASRLADFDPDVVLHFGFHSRAHGFAIEDCARNRTAPLADAAGEEWRGTEIIPGGPHLLRAPSPAIRLATHLAHRGLPARPSSDAGRYLCNMVFYLSLERRRRTGRPALVHFIHIPPLFENTGRNAGNAISRTTLDAGVGAIIGYTLARLRRAKAAAEAHDEKEPA